MIQEAPYDILTALLIEEYLKQFIQEQFLLKRQATRISQGSPGGYVQESRTEEEG